MPAKTPHINWPLPASLRNKLRAQAKRESEERKVKVLMPEVGLRLIREGLARLTEKE